MRLRPTTSSDGVREQIFQLGDVTGVLWTPQGSTGPRPLILLGHGGGQHKKAPGVVFRANHFVTELGVAAVAVDVPNHGDRTDERYDRIVAENQARVAAGEDLSSVIAGFQELAARQTVPEWRAVLDAVQELDHVGSCPVGYWGISLGCGLGVPFVAAEPRVSAAVLGLGGAFGEAADLARRITVPVEFLVQWDDERVPRDRSLALFDALGSAEKTLHANPGRHADRMPRHELESTTRFFARHLVQPG
jgi:dienelactone hydrolase